MFEFIFKEVFFKYEYELKTFITITKRDRDRQREREEKGDVFERQKVNKVTLADIILFTIIVIDFASVTTV